MNTCQNVNMRREPLIPLQTLERIPGVSTSPAADDLRLYGEGRGAITDVRTSAGTERYVVLYEPRVTTTTLPFVVSRLVRLKRKSGHLPLLLTEHVTPAVANGLQEQRIAFADAAGNAYLDGEVGFLLILGRRPERRPSKSGLTHTDLELVYALLSDPALLRRPMRAIAKVTGISLGKVSNTMRTLTEQQYVARRKNLGCMLQDPGRLLERWEYGYLEQLRPRLNPSTWRLGPKATFEDALRLARELEDVLIGGEHAADAYTQNLKPATLTLHVPPGAIKRLAIALRLGPQLDEGNVTILERFRSRLDAARAEPHGAQPLETGLAHPILVRSELLASGSDRLREVADQVLERLIEPSLSDAA